MGNGSKSRSAILISGSRLSAQIRIRITPAMLLTDYFNFLLGYLNAFKHIWWLVPYTVPLLSYHVFSITCMSDWFPVWVMCHEIFNDTFWVDCPCFVRNRLNVTPFPQSGNKRIFISYISCCTFVWRLRQQLVSPWARRAPMLCTWVSAWRRPVLAWSAAYTRAAATCGAAWRDTRPPLPLERP